MNNHTELESINTLMAFSNEEFIKSKTDSKDNTTINRFFTYQWWKYSLDRVIAFFGIIVFSPVMGIIALITKLDSHGEAIYRREQVGENGRIFTAYKFRTMQTGNDDREYKNYIVKYICENAPYKIDENGKPIYKVVDDPRVTRFGALLRKTNLDELPQLFNMLKGDMSLIGPRPDIPFAVDLYKNWHRQRLQVKPGITGLWQVCRRKEVSFEEMVRIDLTYIKKQSLFLDMKIFWSTVSDFLKMSNGS
jgi:lipopolysaccharide/colanic/teichoic acid biosynthesis glycosyltransferase